MVCFNFKSGAPIKVGVFLFLYVLIGIFSVQSYALAAVDDEIAEGRSYLSAHNLLSANSSFEEALALDDTHPVANFFYSITRILAITYGSEFNDLLDLLGISTTGRDIYNWTADFQRDLEGDIILPSDSPTSGETIAFLKDTVLPEIEGALSNLSFIDETLNLILTPAETLNDISLEADFGDVALYESALQGLKSLILILDAYDLNVDIDTIVSQLSSDTFSINTSLFGVYPNLLKLQASHSLGDTKAFIKNAIDSYFVASDFIRNESDPQWDDLVAIDPEELAEELEFRQDLQTTKDSLDGAVNLDDGTAIDFSVYFNDPFHLRDFLPEFTEDNEIAICSFPDPTFGGILPDFTQHDLAIFLDSENIRGCRRGMPWLNLLLHND